jgi:hypothetical protein
VRPALTRLLGHRLRADPAPRVGWVTRDAMGANVWRFRFAALVGWRFGSTPACRSSTTSKTSSRRGDRTPPPGPALPTARACEKLPPRAALVVTVDEVIADHNARRGRPQKMIAVRIAALRWDTPKPRPDLIRERLSLAPGTWTILYHWVPSSMRGLKGLCDVILASEQADAHLALFGDGLMRDTLARCSEYPRNGNRIHVIDPVKPDALPPWVASADVAAIAMPPATRNLDLATPNGLLECLAAGTPPR